MSGSIRARVQRLEQRSSNGGIINVVIGGFRYIGGKNGVLKVPGMAASEAAWLLPDFKEGDDYGEFVERFV